MHKKYLFFFIAVIAFAFVRAGTIAAVPNLSIKIDGQVRNFQPPAQIVNGYTMVPLRFVVEDEALKGGVDWEDKLQKVTVSCREKLFEFYIADRTVTINGQTFKLDTPPYIFQGRTYIPLRFLAEQLGASVGWNGQKREVSINFNPAEGEEESPGNSSKPLVFAYYYGRVLSEFKANAQLFTDVSFRWFETNASGDLFYEYQDDYAGIINFAHSQGIKAHASVVFMDKAGLHTLLSNPANRDNLINNLVSQVQSNGYDGVNIDFEFLGNADRENFTAFLRELKMQLGPQKELSAAIFACTRPESWLAGYDYQAIGNITDRVVVMAYDYSYKGSDPGPVAPLWWVEDVVDYLTNIIPGKKLLLGMPTYGYDWGEGTDATTVTSKKLNDLNNKYGLAENFDNGSMSPYYTYTDGNNIYHQIWLENELSLGEKWNVAMEHQLGGVSFWRIGNGFTALYNVLQNNI